MAADVSMEAVERLRIGLMWGRLGRQDKTKFWDDKDAALAEIENELRRLREERDDYERAASGLSADVSRMGRELEAHREITGDVLEVERRAEAAERALAGMRPYVQHRSTCILNVSQSVLRKGDWCDCGLREILDAALRPTSKDSAVEEHEWVPAEVVNEYGQKVGPQGMWRPKRRPTSEDSAWKQQEC